MLTPMRRASPSLLLALLSLAACPGTEPAADAGPNVAWAPTFNGTNVGWLLDTCGSSADDVYTVAGSLSQAAVMQLGRRDRRRGHARRHARRLSAVTGAQNVL